MTARALIIELFLLFAAFELVCFARPDTVPFSSLDVGIFAVIGILTVSLAVRMRRAGL